jgi:hypothetical protein
VNMVTCPGFEGGLLKAMAFMSELPIAKKRCWLVNDG